MNIVIKDAEFSDIPHLVQMGQDMAQESPLYQRYNYHPKKCAQLLINGIQSPYGIVLVAKDESDGNEIVGFFIGTVTEMFFSSDKAAQDLILYVTPEYRKTGVAGMMIKKYVAQAKSYGAKDVRLGTTTGVLTEQTEALYESRGFVRIGGNFTLKGDM